MMKSQGGRYGLTEGIGYGWRIALRKKCPYSELFWSAFSAFGLNTERHAEEVQKCGPENKKMRTSITPNTDTFYAMLVGTIILKGHKFVNTDLKT